MWAKPHQKNCTDLECPFPQCKNYTKKKYTFNIPGENSDDCNYKTNTNCKFGCQNNNIKYNTSISKIDPNDIIGTTFIVNGTVVEVGFKKSVYNDVINKKSCVEITEILSNSQMESQLMSYN